MIYLDYAANTPPDTEVLEYFSQISREYIANPNSTHPLGKMANQKMSEIIKLMGFHFDASEGYECIFTSGASESNNLAIKGIAETYKENGKHIISTFLEHQSVSGALTYLQSRGYEIDLVDIGRDGRVDLEHLRQLVRKDTILVSVCYVDSELGTIQPIKEIAEILRDYPNCYFHTDATQAVGKIPVRFEGIDLISFAPHKFYGLNGVGVLFRKRDVILNPLIHGGTSSSIYRSGTPALALAASAERAVSLALANLQSRHDYVKSINDYLRNRLSEYKNVLINSPEKNVSPYILNVSVRGVKAYAFKEALEEYGVCVSIKSACSVEKTPSRAVYAISGDKKRAMESWRISLSHLTTWEEIDKFLSAFENCYGRLAGK